MATRASGSQLEQNTASVPWYMNGASVVNPLTDPYFGSVESGDGQFSLGDGRGGAYAGLLNQFVPQFYNGGGGSSENSFGGWDKNAIAEWLQQNGYSLMSNEGNDPNNKANVARWIQDAQGNVLGGGPEFAQDDPNGTLKAIALAAGGYFGGGALANAYGGAGAAASSVAGDAAWEAATQAALEGSGNYYVGANAAAIDAANAAAIAEMGGNSLAPLQGTQGLELNTPEVSNAGQTPLGEAAPSPGQMPPMNNMIPAATTGGGLLQQAAQWAAQNPKLVGAVVGGLAGAGGSSGGSGGGSSGPMPTINRGQWSPSATPQYMQAPNFNWQAPTTGNANSGLWQFSGGQSQSLMPQQQSLLPQPQAQSLLGPANQTQWQQPTGPTFNMSGQQLNQGSAMTQQNTPPTFSGVGYGSPTVDTTTPSPVSSGGSPSTAPAGFADMYRNHIGNASMTDEDAASRLATAARRYQMFGQSSDGLFGFTPESFKAYQSGNADAFRAALGSPAQKPLDPMYRYTGNAAGQAASDKALAAVQAQKWGTPAQPGGPMFQTGGGLLPDISTTQNKYNPTNKA